MDNFNNIDCSERFFKIWRNLVIKKEIFKHLEIFRVNQKGVYISRTLYLRNPYRGYLSNLILDVQEGEKIQIGDIGPNVNRMVFGRNFNQNLYGLLPENSIKELVLGDKFNQPVFESDIPSSVTTLVFGFKFNIIYDKLQENIFIPNSVTSLTFQGSFNQPLGGILPKSLKHLVLSSSFNQFILKSDLPDGLESIVFGRLFNQPLSELPSSITSITLGDEFNKSIKPNQIPSNCKILKFGNRFNQSLHKNVLPSGLEYLEFGQAFSKPLYDDRFYIPPNVKTIIFGGFNETLLPFKIPNSVTSITFGDEFKKEINQNSLPNSLTYLKFGSGFNSLIDEGVLGNSLTSLSFGYGFVQPLDNIPPSVKSLSLVSPTPYYKYKGIPNTVENLNIIQKIY